MTARKTRRPLTAEADKFTPGAFQPPQARSGMMKVAGASDDDPGVAGEQLITDNDPTTMKGPVYDEGLVVTTMGQLRKLLIRELRIRE